MSRFCLALCSGGLDSATMLYELIESGEYPEIIPLHFHFGQKNFVFERLCVSRLCKELGLMPEFYDLEKIYEPWFLHVEVRNLAKLKFELPFRNLLLLTCAGIIGQSKLLYLHGDAFRSKSNGFDIAIAVHKHVTYEEYWDIRPGFVEGAQKLFSLAPFDVRVVAPFVGLEKRQIVERSRKFNWQVLKYTATCYSPIYLKRDSEKLIIRPCGHCESCIERAHHIGPEINDYELEFTYKEAVCNGVPPRALRKVFLD